MNIAVQKSEEDALLSECDNSCANGDKCVCKKMFGMSNAGQGMYDYGINKCVLCLRKEYSKKKISIPYRVIVDGYPKIWVTEGPFIRFSKNDYQTDGERCVTQKTQGLILNPDSWITKIYDTAVIKVPESSTKWFLSVCETEGCKKPIHTFIDEHRSIGINNSYMDLTSGVVKCKFCNSPNGISYIYDDGGIVNYLGVEYSQCRFCSTVVRHDRETSVQICTTCYKIRQEELKLIERVCMYCNNTVHINKKGGSQTLIVKGSDGQVKDAYLCRYHKIKSLDSSEVYDQGYIESLLKS